jgi:GST-like protein
MQRDEPVLELYGARGCGSAVVEALLAWAAVPFAYREIDLDAEGAGRDAFLAINPLGQVPALRLPDGTVITESAAIILHLAERHPEARLLPASGDPARAQALRWIAYIAGNIYPAIGVRDFPARWVKDASAREALRRGARARLEHYWSVLERVLAPAPYLVGARVTALDVYAAMVSRWSPGRAWIDRQCPRVATALALTEREPFMREAWQRNFGGG